MGVQLNDTFKMLLFHYMDKGKSLDLPFLHEVAVSSFLLSCTPAQLTRPIVDWNMSCAVKDLQCLLQRVFQWLFMNDNHRLLWPVTVHGSGEVNCKYSFHMLLVVQICSSGYEGHHSPITYKPWNGKQASHIRQHIVQPPNSKGTVRNLKLAYF